MLRQLPKLLLLVALLATLLISSVPALAGGCHFDKTTGQCISNGCACGLGCKCVKGF